LVVAWLLAITGLFAHVFAQDADPPAPPGGNPPLAQVDRLRKVYRQDADQYAFSLDDQHDQPLHLVEQPVLRWFNDDDWSGDVFVWAHGGRPVVIGCLLSGPEGDSHRIFFHEFHLLSEQPIAPADLQTHRRWQPKAGLARQPAPGAPPPGATAAARLAQMRAMSREFTAHMEADGVWELRLLPQPIYRYGDEQGDVADGALFAYVWTKGTDPEVLLLLESRKTAQGQAWHYAPVRFSNREVWLRRDGVEVWRAASHREPEGATTDQVYTTAYARTAPITELETPGKESEPNR
jgi:hypothetical protein